MQETTISVQLGPLPTARQDNNTMLNVTDYASQTIHSTALLCPRFPSWAATPSPLGQETFVCVSILDRAVEAARHEANAQHSTAYHPPAQGLRKMPIARCVKVCNTTCTAAIRTGRAMSQLLR
eukprot:3111675-Rhodomonas_salina.2